LKRQWVSGNKFTLLENGEAFYPRVFEAIASARRTVLLETFILYEDKVGLALHAALLQAARNGAQVDITIDGYGSPNLSSEFIASLTSAGIRMHVFDPGPKLFGRRTKMFRRLHRKLVVVDCRRAFMGGINYSADHLADYGPEAKQDYSVEIEGPIVAHIHNFAREAITAGKQGWRWLHRQPVPAAMETLPPAGNAEALLVWRDNAKHKTDIERQYRLAIRLAQRRIVIACAYFFPGYAFLRDLRRAARRGVEVSLILQGKPDMPIVRWAASMLYYHLLRAGVHIHEYRERPLHAKVALVDDEWATVGSSNLDPLSLALNLEVNVMIRDRDFNEQLSQSLQRLTRHSCKEIEVEDLKENGAWRQVRGFFLYHLLRRYPQWAGWLPAHTPRLMPAHLDIEGGSDRLTESASPSESSTA
jgi:cardiolipin synthase